MNFEDKHSHWRKQKNDKKLEEYKGTARDVFMLVLLLPMCYLLAITILSI